MLYHPAKKIIRHRVENTAIADSFSHFPPLIQRLYATRHITDKNEITLSLNKLPAPWLLSGMEEMVTILADCIIHHRRVIVIGDYDADGATASAVAVRGLKACGLYTVSYLVPNRFEYGYGLSHEIVTAAAKHRPDFLLTVDNGIVHHEGVRTANALGIGVLITDHHTPGPELPKAAAIVNPALPGNLFPSKSLAGVGVVFYVLIALRHRLRTIGHFIQSGIPEPDLRNLLDLVALGTIADVVHLDHVNRTLVYHGLQRIRSGKGTPGITALLNMAGRTCSHATVTDLSFSVAPRLNAAGRMDDMSIGIECLLSDNAEKALDSATVLDQLNRDRKETEVSMKKEALTLLGEYSHPDYLQSALCLFDENWHQGCIGLIASRVKEQLHRPVFALAPTQPGSDELRGSGRSIPGVHIRDVLADIAARQPDILKKFGGHAMAAGLTLSRDHLETFRKELEKEVTHRLPGLNLEQVIYTDGYLEPGAMNLSTVDMLEQAGPWGQGFPPPLFDGSFDIVSHRTIGGGHHLKLVLRSNLTSQHIEGIAFHVLRPENWSSCKTIRAAYHLEVNQYQNTNRRLQLRLEYMEKLA